MPDLPGTVSTIVAHASREGMAWWFAMGVVHGGGKNLPGTPDEFARTYADAWLVWDQSPHTKSDDYFVTIATAFDRWVRTGSVAE